MTGRFLQRSLGAHWRGFTLGFVVLGAGTPAALYMRTVVLPEQPTVAAAMAPGDTVEVFGPRQFNGSGGSGTTYIERFTVALVPGRKYELTLVNGTAGGANRATRAVTTLNGYSVVSSTDLTSSTASFTTVVSVRQVDTLRTTVVGPAGSFVIATISSLASSEFIVNGPADYGIPSGTQKTHTFSFSTPATAGPPFRVYLTNGDSLGGLRVTNASVTLNGTTVVTTQEFSTAIGSLTKPVTLTASNNVTVTLKGNAARFVTVWFTASDTAAPAVAITSPPADSVVRTSPITVTGTISDASPTGVTVNGVQATVTNNTSYSASVPLSTQGSNTLTAIATDAGGRTSQVTRNVFFDSQAPSLTVTAPADNAVTKEASVTVSGTALDATAVTVNTNGTPFTVGGGGAFSGSIALAHGANVLTTTATDAAGNATSVVRNVTRDTVPPVLTVSAPANGASTPDDSITVSGTVTDETAVTVAANGINLPVTSGNFSGKVGLVAGPNTITVIATDAATNSTAVNRSVTREEPEPELPPDPSEVAPPLDQTVAADLSTSTSFLYTGSNPIQTGVSPGTIVPARVAVLRGRVLDRAGAPLSGVELAVLGHPELGQTLSRDDGRFDLAVNAGADLTVTYTKSGFLASQRLVPTVWQAYENLDDVALVPADAQVTTINFTQPIEVARASEVQDDDGTRQASVMFRQGTQATLVMADGSTQPLTSASVRITEYTVGATGQQAMPGTLPPASAYTYAANLGVDEATAAGAKEVRFDQPVAFYVGNFLNIPVGARVPLGYYDRVSGKWRPEPDGRVIKLLDKVAGRAVLAVGSDSTRTATQVELDSLGITTAELDRLGSDAAYAVGTSWWRTQHTHFSPFDWNYAWWIAVNAFDAVVDVVREALDDPTCRSGSVIGCENQTLGEVLPLAGTPFSLRYQSDRTAGYSFGTQLTVPALNRVSQASLAGATRLQRNTFPDHVVRIVYRLRVAGQTISMSPTLGASVAATTITWNGRDFADRILNGRQKAELIVAFCYPASYATSGGGGGGGGGFGGSAGNVAYANSAFRPECIERAQPVWTGFLDVWRNKPLGFGGWSLDVHHAYDPSSGTLYLGNGDKRAAGVLGNTVQHIPSTNGFFCSAFNCGIPIFDKSDAGRLAAGPDGSLYISYPNEHKTRRLSRIGDTLTTFADSTDPTGLAFGPDGSLYMAEWTRNRVRRRAPDGTMTVVTGTGVAGFSGDGGPAELAQVNRPNDVAVGPDGAVFIAEDNGHRIRRIGPDGIITTYGGTGVSGTPVSGARATATPIGNPRTLTVGQDGSVYVGTANRVVRIGTDGVLTLFAGTTTGTTPATRTALSNVNQLVATRDGIIVATFVTIYRVSLDGNIETVAGRQRTRCITLTQAVHCEPFVDGNLAGQTYLEGVTGAAVGPDGSLFFAESNFNSGKYFIRRVRPAMPGVTFGSMLIAAEDGREIYQFDAAGRHLFTRDPNTGDTLYTFGHDSAGRLVTVRDAHANVTSIERSPTTGVATAVEGPFGQRTTLETDGAGYLSRVLDPAGNAVRLFSKPNGLLDSMVTPRGHAHRFAYDGVGRLISDHDPAGGSQTLTRTKSDTGYTVAVTTEMGRTTRYKVERLPGGDERREVVAPSGLGTATTIRRNGERVRTTPDGTVMTTTDAADPRYGLQAPYVARAVVRLPSGDSSVVTASRSASLASASDPISLRGASETVTVNGNAFISRDTLITGTIRSTRTTPEGRQFLLRSDSVGRVQMTRSAGLDSVLYRYNSLGRLDRIQSGGQLWTLTYNARGKLETTTDPLGRKDSLFYDPADRLTRRVLPGGRELLIAYDSAGNVISVTPPGRTVHGFSYSPIGLTSNFTPPNVGLTTPATRYQYNADRQLTRITRPDSVDVAFDYDAAGRPSTVTFDRGQLGYGYGLATGNLTSITAPGGNTLTYTYDGALPKTVSWSGLVQGSVEAFYNNDLRADTLTVNGSNPIAFKYDRDGLLTAAGALGVKRQSQHGLPERDSVDAIKVAWSHTPRAALAAYTATSGGSTFFQIAYLRDSLDRITQMTETIGPELAVTAFTYDTAGRLQEVRRDGSVTATYEYDQNGNRLHLTRPIGTLSGTYDAQDRLVTYGANTYTYGSNGELKTKADQSGTTSYSYDALGNLVAVALPNAVEITYVVDGQNRRVGKRLNGNLVQGFLYQSQLNPVAEIDGNQQLVSRFVYGIRSNVPDLMIKGGVTYRLITDHLGSVRLVVNAANGAVVQRIDYDEFGQVTQNTAPGFQPFGYAGGLQDEDTKLVRFGARDYDPATGRWTARDPVQFSGGDLNYYAYGAGDPINTADVTGLRPHDPTSAYCRSLSQKIRRIAEKIREKELDLKYDDLGLPETCFGDDKVPGRSKRGHRRIIDGLRERQDELIQKYLDDCGGGTSPQPKLAPEPVPNTVPVPSQETLRQVEEAGKIGIVGTILIYTWYILTGIVFG